MVKIRLRRMGSRNHPFYRVVVSDARKTPTGAALDEIGYYDPRKQPAVVSIDRERLDRWVGKGALLSPTVSKLLRQAAASASAGEAEREGRARGETIRHVGEDLHRDLAAQAVRGGDASDGDGLGRRRGRSGAGGDRCRAARPALSPGLVGPGCPPVRGS